MSVCANAQTTTVRTATPAATTNAIIQNSVQPSTFNSGQFSASGYTAGAVSIKSGALVTNLTFNGLSTGQVAYIDTSGILATPNGAAGALTSIRSNLNVLALEDDFARIQSHPAGGLIFDGTANKYVQVAAFPTIGTNDFSIRLMFRVPATNPSATVSLFAAGNSTTSHATGGIWAYINTAGYFKFILQGATPDVNVARWYFPLVAAKAGKAVDVVITRTGTTIVMYLNGVAQTLVNDDTASPPTWDSAIVSSYLYIGNDALSSTQTYTSGAYRVQLFNLTLTQAEVVEIMMVGVPQRMKWPAGWTPLIGTGVNNGDFTSFTLNAPTGWATNLLTTSDLGPGVRMTANASYVDNFNSRLASPFTGRISRTYRVTTVAKQTTGPGNLMGSFTQTTSVDSFTHTLTSSYTTNTATVSTVGTPAALSFRISGGTASVSVVDLLSVKVEELGCVYDADLQVGCGYQIPDRSANKLYGYGTTNGWQHKLPTYKGRVVKTGVLASGTTMLAAGYTLPPNAVITGATIRRIGSNNLTGLYLGSSSGGGALTPTVDLTTTNTYTFTITNAAPALPGATAEIFVNGASFSAPTTATVTLDYNIYD